MPIPVSRQLFLTRMIALIAGIYLAFRWVETIRYSADRLHFVFYLLTLAVFIFLAVKAWNGALWAGITAACWPLTMLVPLNSVDHFLMAMAMWSGPKTVFLYTSSLFFCSIPWVFLAVIKRRLPA